MELKRSSTKHKSSEAAATAKVVESDIIEDLPPSYSSMLFQDVDERSRKDFDQHAHRHDQPLDADNKSEFIITNQPVTTAPRTNSSDSLELSTRSSLQSTRLSTDTYGLLGHRSPPKKNNAWNENNRNQQFNQLNQINQFTLLCFCSSALTSIAALGFWCTSLQL